MLLIPLCACEVRAAELRVGRAELIYTDDEIPIRYDGSLSTIKEEDGRMLFFHSFGCRLKDQAYRRSRHSWHTGTPKDPLRTHLSSRTDEALWGYNGWYENTDQRGIWILGMYEAPNGDLLGITHSEVKYPKKPQQFALGIGYSRDRGRSWTYCGEIVKAADPHRNVGGGAYHLVGDYLQVYYNDTQGSCMARAKIADVLREARQQRVGSWHKRRDGRWDVPGLSATSGTPILLHGHDLHSDAAYCTPLKKYLLTATLETSEVIKLLLFSSSDAVTWQLEAVLDSTKKDSIEDRLGQPYSTFVDFDGPTRDCHEVDGDFHIYFPRKNMKYQDWDVMYRVQLKVE